MARFEVDTDLIVHCKVRVIVEADDKESAIVAAFALLPANWDHGSAKAWKATVNLKPPKGVEIRVLRAYHFEQSSGDDRARPAKIASNTGGPKTHGL